MLLLHPRYKKFKILIRCHSFIENQWHQEIFNYKLYKFLSLIRMVQNLIINIFQVIRSILKRNSHNNNDKIISIMLLPGKIDEVVELQLSINNVECPKIYRSKSKSLVKVIQMFQELRHIVINIYLNFSQPLNIPNQLDPNYRFFILIKLKERSEYGLTIENLIISV